MMYGLELEPGDLVGLTGLGDDFRDEVFKVVETLHGANHVVEFVAEAFMNCEIPSGDPYWSNVVLLMGFEDSDTSIGAPGYTDESPAAHGTAGRTNTSEIDTAQFKFGSSSLKADGNGWSALYAPSHDWWLSQANSDQFTVEAWVRFASYPHDPNVIVGTSFVGQQWNFGVTAAGEMRFAFLPGLGGASVAIVSSGAAIAFGTWYHLAVDKDATGKIRLYKNGVMVGSDTPTDSSFVGSDSSGLDIGATGFIGSYAMDGWIDELRITAGVARYESDGGFTVPTSAFPREST